MLRLKPFPALLRLLLKLLVLLMSTTPVQAMTAGEALRLTQAWAHSSGADADLAGMAVQPGGDFEVQVRGARLAFQSGLHRLVVSGLVGQDMLQLTVSPAAWQKLQRAAALEAPTLGEGQFELLSVKTLNADPPVLLLSKAFSNGALSEQQFLIEVRWLLEWATHWRKIRLRELFSGRTPEELDKQGRTYVEMARRQRPRPW